MTKIALVRHGETDYNRNNIIQGQVDIPLNEYGKKQAYQTANNFKAENIGVIISSPLSRAKETAKIIAQEINYQKEIIIDDAFIERNFGIADGKKISLFYDKVLNQNVKDLETKTALKERTMHGLNKIIKKYKNKNIIIVCHSHTIKAILNYLEPQKYNFNTKLKNCGITLIEHQNNEYKIIKASFNNYL